MSENNETIKNIIETGSEISGGIGGAVIGGLVAGPAGLIVGGVSGPIITRIFKSLGEEVRKRTIGKREAIRIGAIYAFAINKITENEAGGLSLRTDSFFNEFNNNRSSSEEVLEGVVISSQREFEEKKIKYMGNLYANICFKSEVSKEHANQLIRMADNLSYRQFCILQLMNERYLDSQQFNFKVRVFEKWQIDSIDIIAEIRDLQQRGLLHIPTTFDGGDNSAPINLDRLSITKSGLHFCDMLSLETIEKEILDELNRATSIRG
jgi:hypothetical protein